MHPDDIAVQERYRPASLDQLFKQPLSGGGLPGTAQTSEPDAKASWILKAGLGFLSGIATMLDGQNELSLHYQSFHFLQPESVDGQ